MYRVKGSGLTGRGASWGVAAANTSTATHCGVGGMRVGGGGKGRLRWWAAVIGLALAVLGLFTAVTLWLGFSVTAAAPSPTPSPTPTPTPTPNARQGSSSSTPDVPGTQSGRVRETKAASSRPRPRPAAAPDAAKGVAEVVLSSDDDERFARDPAPAPAPEAATPATAIEPEEDDDEAMLVPTGEEDEGDEEELAADSSEQRFYIDDDEEPSSSSSWRHRPLVPPSPHPIPQTPTLAFPRDAHVPPTQRHLPPTPPTLFAAQDHHHHQAPAATPDNHRRVSSSAAAAAGGSPSDDRHRYSIRRSGSSAKDDAFQVPSSGTLDQHTAYKEDNPRVDSNMYAIRVNGRPQKGNRRTDEAEAAFKHHLLEEASQGGQGGQGGQQLPSDEALNEYLLREMAADSASEELVQREIPEGGTPTNLLLLGALGRYPTKHDVAGAAGAKVQYYVQESPSSTTAATPSGGGPVSSFLQRRVQELHSWLGPASQPPQASSWSAGGGDAYADLRHVLAALNHSLAAGDATPVLRHLRELYYRGGGGSGAGNVPQTLRNSSSLLSVGLLAFDLLLLHNVQQIAWGEEPAAGRAMLQDPEVAALNSLFLDPTRMRTTDPLMAALDANASPAGQEVNLLEELVEFVKSGARAVLTLGRAYRSGGDALDCVWTLYCRNLDKTARMRGPYGFLARLNGLGLRLLMGEFPLESALDTILREMSHGWTTIDCANFFPKCSPEIATRVVLQTAMGNALEEGLKLQTKSEIPVLRTGGTTMGITKSEDKHQQSPVGVTTTTHAPITTTDHSA